MSVFLKTRSQLQKYDKRLSSGVIFTTSCKHVHGYFPRKTLLLLHGWLQSLVFLFQSSSSNKQAVNLQIRILWIYLWDISMIEFLEKLNLCFMGGLHRLVEFSIISVEPGNAARVSQSLPGIIKSLLYSQGSACYFHK